MTRNVGRKRKEKELPKVIQRRITSWESQRRKIRAGEKPHPAFDLSPLAQARYLLGERLTEKLGSYWLDGRPTGLFQLMEITGVKLQKDSYL